MTTEQDRPKAGAEDAPASAAEDEIEIEIEVVDDEAAIDAKAKTAKPEKAAAGEGDEPPGDGEEDDGEADDRVKRERARRRKAERERDAYARQSAAKDEKLAEMDGRLAKVETRQVRDSLGTAEARLAAFDRDVADAKKARRQAKADGDDEAEETATELWIRTQAKRDNLAGLIDQARRRGTTRGEEGETEGRGGKQRSQPAPEPAITPQAKAWMRRNAAWFDPDLGDEQSQMAAKASEVLTAQGLDHDDPKHFEALDKRMKALYPDLYRNKDAGRPTGAAGGSRGGAEQKGNGRQTVQLPRGLVRNFEAAGFDVNDPKVKVQMVKSYQEQQAKASGGRAR